MLALTLAAAAAAGPKGFTVTDAILGSGPDVLNMTVLANRDTGEKFGIVSQSGGKECLAAASSEVNVSVATAVCDTSTTLGNECHKSTQKPG